MKLLSIASISLLLAFACLRTSAQKPTDKGAMALEDSISKELSYIPAYMGYTTADIPDSVLISRYSKFKFSFSDLNIDSIKLSNDAGLGENILPDSAKIELTRSGVLLSVYNDRKGSAIIIDYPTIKYVLSRQESTEILKLIKQIVFVNRGKIIIAKRKLPYGGKIMDRPGIDFKIYLNGKEQSYAYHYIHREQEDHIITYSQPFIELWRISDWYAIRLWNKWRDINCKEERERIRQLLIRRRARERERQRQQAEQAEQAQQAEQAVPAQ